MPFEMPMLLYGVDLTDMMRDMAAKSDEFFKTSGANARGTLQLDEDAMNKSTKRRP